MGLKGLASGISKLSGGHVIAYGTLALDKIVLLVLFLLRRLESPAKSGVNILLTTHWTTLVRALFQPEADRQFLTLTRSLLLCILNMLDENIVRIRLVYKNAL